MPLWRDDVWAETKNDETEKLSEKKSDPCLENSGDKNPYGEHEFGVFEQLKRDSVYILKDLSDWPVGGD